MNRLLLKLLSYPPIGRLAIKTVKKNAFKPLQIPLESAMERQREMLRRKFKRMEKTCIGRKMGIHRNSKLEDLPITDYEFYRPFYEKPSPGDLIYPLNKYRRARTSGTAGTEKWFMIPKKEFEAMARETSLATLCALFHNGEECTLEYGDKIYINVAPRPFIGGYMISEAVEKIVLVNVVPNINLSYREKIRYFIFNYDKVDAAVMSASTLVSQIMPAIERPLRLKGLILLDSPIGEAYRDKIEDFTGTIPKSVYGSTETLACSIPSVEYPLGFILDWRRGVFEFLPVDKERSRENLLKMDEIEVGKVYRIIYTSFFGELTRYDLKDAFKCIARGDNILGIELPVFKFYARVEKTISLLNFTRIDEEELMEAFKRAGISFVDFTVRKEIESGLEHLVIYLEHEEDQSAESIRKAIHEVLYKIDSDYRDLVNFYDYVPVKVCILPRGTFATFLQEKKASIQKVDRINMRDNEFNRLLEVAGELSKGQ